MAVFSLVPPLSKPHAEQAEHNAADTITRITILVVAVVMVIVVFLARQVFLVLWLSRRLFAWLSTIDLDIERSTIRPLGLYLL